MNGESIAEIIAREAIRQNKDPAVHLAYTSRCYDLNARPLQIAGSALMIIARLSGNIQWEAEDEAQE